MSKNTKKIKSLFSRPAEPAPVPAQAPAPAPVAALRPTTAAVQAVVQGTPRPNQAGTKPNRVLLELVKPDARQVCVAGSFNNWKPEQTPLAPAGNGRWVGNLAVGPGRHEYLFVVDGQWLPDPNAREVVPNPYGGKNSVLIVSE